jgi:hypothetical protein
MQNTTSIQAVPGTLISNFFVAGLHSETLLSCLKIGKAVNIPPEILFHTYGTLDSVKNYLPVKICLTIIFLVSVPAERLGGL